MAEPKHNSFRDQFSRESLPLWQKIGLLEEEQIATREDIKKTLDVLQAQVSNHDKLIHLLVLQVQGSQDIGHKGLANQINEMNTAISTIKEQQEKGEQERTKARQQAELERQVKEAQDKARWAGTMIGLTLAAVPGIKEVIEGIGELLGFL